jgi:excisionase family DNA binding protein
MVDTPEQHELLTAAEVAKAFRVSRQTVIRWATDGVIPAIRVGRDWRFRRSDVEQLLTPITPDTEAVS